ncbi:MAG: transposase [Rivularia sp. ALOHA_DT_140]|nr:transposase [Rivularia sp. ALOHA_DT_140]
MCNEIARSTLRKAIEWVRLKYPFKIDAFVLLPEHLHCILTLPDGDDNYSIRWKWIKTFVTKRCEDKFALKYPMSESGKKRQEGNLWQRRFWEHLIRDEEDFQAHCDYIHYNSVKHGLCSSPQDWQFSSFHRFVKKGVYSQDWGVNEIPKILELIADEEFE